MDRVGEWRLIDSDEAEEEAKAPAPKPDQKPNKRLLLGVGAAVVMLAGAAIWLTLPQPTVRLDITGAAIATDFIIPGETSLASSAAAVAEILVDVQGAVAIPGLHRLPNDSRVGDAIAAAGGYSVQVDIAASSALLNLAERLVDGDKVHVPARGEVALAFPNEAAPNESSAPGPGGGLIDVNHASAEQLDTLPSIGPVTAEKIIAARDEAPFASVDDLLARSVVGPSTMDKIRDLITVQP